MHRNAHRSAVLRVHPVLSPADRLQTAGERNGSRAPRVNLTGVLAMRAAVLCRNHVGLGTVWIEQRWLSATRDR